MNRRLWVSCWLLVLVLPWIDASRRLRKRTIMHQYPSFQTPSTAFEPFPQTAASTPTSQSSQRNLLPFEQLPNIMSLNLQHPSSSTLLKSLQHRNYSVPGLPDCFVHIQESQINFILPENNIHMGLTGPFAAIQFEYHLICTVAHQKAQTCLSAQVNYRTTPFYRYFNMYPEQDTTNNENTQMTVGNDIMLENGMAIEPLVFIQSLLGSSHGCPKSTDTFAIQERITSRLGGHIMALQDTSRYSVARRQFSALGKHLELPCYLVDSLIRDPSLDPETWRPRTGQLRSFYTRSGFQYSASLYLSDVMKALDYLSTVSVNSMMNQINEKHAYGPHLKKLLEFHSDHVHNTFINMLRSLLERTLIFNDVGLSKDLYVVLWLTLAMPSHQPLQTVFYSDSPVQKHFMALYHPLPLEKYVYAD